jgi:phosphoribosylamine--glycine ligase
MRVLIIGNGGREHALAWKIAQSAQVTEVLVAPGNASCARVARVVPAELTVPSLLAVAKREQVDLTVVGYEPLFAAGIVDAFRSADLAILGPDQRAAGLTASRIQTKVFLARHHVPTSPYKVATTVDEAVQVAASLLPTSGVVIKRDERMTAGSVAAPESIDDARAMIEATFAGGAEHILLEAKLRGREVSVPFLTDGSSWLMLPWVKRLTRTGNGDTGLVTGGMGAYAPAGRRDDDADLILRDVVAPIVRGLHADGIDCRGWLQANLLFTGAGPQVISLQAVLGPQEAQVIMPVLKDDLVAFFEAILAGRLDELELTPPDRLALSVLLATPGYPLSPRDVPVTGLQALDADPRFLWFGEGLAGDAADGWHACGRAVTCVGLAGQRQQAQRVAYEGVRLVAMGGEAPVCRTDVGMVP